MSSTSKWTLTPGLLSDSGRALYQGVFAAPGMVLLEQTKADGPRKYTVYHFVSQKQLLSVFVFIFS